MRSALAVCGAATLAACAAPPKPPSVLEFASGPPSDLLVISIDTLRRDHIGRYAAEPDGRTPFLDGLLAEAVVFDDHTSCSSWTFASMLCALTGAYDTELGFVPARDLGLQTTIPDDIELLAQWIDADSALVSANPLVGAGSGMDRGYAHGCVGCEPSRPASEVVDRGAAIASDLASPWLLHLHFMDPHLPYTAAPDAYLAAAGKLRDTGYDLTQGGGYEEVAVDWATLDPGLQAMILEEAEIRYSAEIRYLDDQLARLFAALEAGGALDDAVVLLWSDHGEQFFDHGGIKHGRSVHAEETRAMAAFWSHDLAPLAVAHGTSHADLVPTLLDALDARIPDTVTGRVVTRDAEPIPRFTTSLSYTAETLQSVEIGGDRLIYDWSGTLWLYDVRADPAEMVDLFHPGDPTAAGLWALLAPRVGLAREASGADPPRPPPLGAR